MDERLIEQLIKLPRSVDVPKNRNARVRFRIRGKQISIVIIPKTRNLKEAERLAPKNIVDWFKINTKYLNLIPNSEIPNLWEAIERFVSLTYSDRKPATGKQALRYLRYLEPLFPQPLPEISKTAFELVLSELRGQAAPKEWANRLSVYKRFFKFCVERDWITKSPCEHIKPPPKMQFGGRGKTDLWEEDRFKKVHDELPEIFQTAIKVLWFTGIDIGDLWFLEVGHIKKSKGALIIQKVREKAKSNRELIQCPVSSHIKDLIKESIKKKKSSDRVFDFPNDNKKQFEDKFLLRIKRIQKRLGYLSTKDVKSLRHTFATRQASRGVPMWQLKKWMGHTPESRVLESLYIHDDVDVSFMD